MNDISGFEISTNQLSKRIINIKIKDNTIEKLIFPAGVLIDASHTSRLIVVLLSLFVFFLSKKNFVYPTIFSAISMGILNSYF